MKPKYGDNIRMVYTDITDTDSFVFHTKTDDIYQEPKCYAFIIHGDDKEYKKCKGTAKNTVNIKSNMMITIQY